MTATTQTQTADAPEQETTDAIEAIVAHMTAGEIRSWMSENGLTRSRGARKRPSAIQAYEQDPALVEEKARELESELARFQAYCTHCDFDGRHDTEDEAVEAAKGHKSENPTHFPRAVDTETEERLYS